MLSSYKENKDEDNLKLDNDSRIAHDHLNAKNIKSKKDENGNFLHLTNDQKKYVTSAEKDLSSGKQVLYLIHRSAGVGKSFLTNILQEAVELSSKILVVEFLTGSAVTMLDREKFLSYHD